jgi:FkbM family methyltransferase
MRRIARRARKASLLLGEPLWRRGLLKGTAASVEHDQLPLRPDYATVIDVGANRGQFALYARVRFPGAQIYSFEPLRQPRDRLTRLFAGDADVHVLACAAGSTAGSAHINVSRRDDSSSLLPPTGRQTERFPGTDTVGSEEVEVRTLDEVFDAARLAGPILLKLDVQGFELEALRGAEKLLAQVDTVLTECSFVPFYEGQALFDDVLQYLSLLGFRVVAGAISSAHDGRWEQGDFVFERA